MNNDLISRQAVIEAICTWDKFGVDERGRVVRWHEGLEPYVHLRDVVMAIEKLPSAQPEIIRCGECKHRYTEGENVVYNVCELNHNKVQPDDWFCAEAERRTDEPDK